MQKFQGQHILIELGSFGIQAIKIREALVWNKDYAQYKDCIHLQYLEKGKRKPKAYAKPRSPWFIIVEGGSIPEFDDALAPVPSNVEGVSCSMSRHSCFSPEWRKEADEYIERNRDKMKIVFEVR